MRGAAEVLRFAVERGAAGEAVVLVTVVGVEGSSSRDVGTHMAVTATGGHAGSLSGGCVEAAVVGEARRILADGRAEIVRFGVGSPYIDVRLPCGGGLDLLFSPEPSRPELRSALHGIERRRAVELTLDPAGGMVTSSAGGRRRTGWRDGRFVVRHDPALRVVIVGHGAETVALARLAACYGAVVEVLSPDRSLVAALSDEGRDARELKTPAATPMLTADPHTAVVLLFHDHDWEADLLAQALGTPAFLVGAMGSRGTHAARLAVLRDHGVPERRLRRVVSPLGLIPSSRDPDTLALSALSQIVERFGRLADEPDRGVTLSRGHRADERGPAAAGDRMG